MLGCSCPAAAGLATSARVVVGAVRPRRPARLHDHPVLLVLPADRRCTCTPSRPGGRRLRRGRSGRSSRFLHRRLGLLPDTQTLLRRRLGAHRQGASSGASGGERTDRARRAVRPVHRDRPGPARTWPGQRRFPPGHRRVRRPLADLAEEAVADASGREDHPGHAARRRRSIPSDAAPASPWRRPASSRVPPRRPGHRRQLLPCSDDGAATVVIMSDAKAARARPHPLAPHRRHRSPASRDHGRSARWTRANQALRPGGPTIDDIDLAEIKAFRRQVDPPTATSASRWRS